MTRSQIRYALFRCKANTPDKTHLDVLAKVQPQLDAVGMTIEHFTTDWDISKDNSEFIVVGHLVKQYNQNVPL